jgi:hypothetical protein
MTPAEQAALQRFMDALLVHEMGHLTIAEQFAKDWSGSDQITATGPTAESAKRNFEQKASELLKKRRADLDADEKVYDQTTEHGVRQSKGPPLYPGGADVILDCP